MKINDTEFNLIMLLENMCEEKDKNDDYVYTYHDIAKAILNSGWVTPAGRLSYLQEVLFSMCWQHAFYDGVFEDAGLSSNELAFEALGIKNGMTYRAAAQTTKQTAKAILESGLVVPAPKPPEGK